MRKLFSTSLFTIGLCVSFFDFFDFNATAQNLAGTNAVPLFTAVQPTVAPSAKLYQLLIGGTTRVLASSTNEIAIGTASTNNYGLPGTFTNLFQNVNEFDYAGFTWSYGAGSNATVQVFISYDNGTIYGAVPAYSFSSPITSGAYSTNALLDVHGATSIAFVLKNASNLDQSNALLEINLKSPKYGAVTKSY